jgi:hypothetical protein
LIGTIMLFAFLATTVSVRFPSASGSFAVPIRLYRRAVPFGSGKKRPPLCVYISSTSVSTSFSVFFTVISLVMVFGV